MPLLESLLHGRPQIVRRAASRVDLGAHGVVEGDVVAAGRRHLLDRLPGRAEAQALLDALPLGGRRRGCEQQERAPFRVRPAFEGIDDAPQP